MDTKAGKKKSGREKRSEDHKQVDIMLHIVWLDVFHQVFNC